MEPEIDLADSRGLSSKELKEIVIEKSDEIRSEKEEVSKGMALGRFGERIERLERIIIRMEGRILNGYKE